METVEGALCIAVDPSPAGHYPIVGEIVLPVFAALLRERYFGLGGESKTSTHRTQRVIPDR